MNGERVLADTSVFIGLEQSRIEAVGSAEMAISTVTVGELKLGVLAATDSHERAERLRTLEQATALEPIAIDSTVADAWAELRVMLRDNGRKLPGNDSWIAATAIAHDLTLATQDEDYQGIPNLSVLML